MPLIISGQGKCHRVVVKQARRKDLFSPRAQAENGDAGDLRLIVVIYGWRDNKVPTAEEE